MKKRQYSVPTFQVVAGNGSGMVAKLVRRKSDGKSFDVINFRIITSGDQDDITFNAAPEEALEIAWGMTKTVRQFMLEFEPYRVFRSQGSDYPISDKEIWWNT